MPSSFHMYNLLYCKSRVKHGFVGHTIFRSVAALEEGSEEWAAKGMRCQEKEPGRAKRKGKGKER